jgi:hypothetical protein
MNFTDDIAIIFIKGVQRKNIKSIESIMEDRLLEEINAVEMYEKKNYDPIPKYFTDLNSWFPLNLNCWYCDRQVCTKPVFIPKSIDKSGDSIVIATEGHFCWFNCAYAYLLSTADSSGGRDNKYHMLKYLAKIFCGIIPSEIIPSPNKYEQLHYRGLGGVSREEFFKKIDNLRC